MRMLVTGGAGYIGSHACVVLLEAGHDVVVLDSLANSSAESLRRIQEIAGRSLVFIRGDVRSPPDLDRAFSLPIDGVVHFAGLKSVAQSCTDPLAYYDNNVGGSIALLKAMQSRGVEKLVFSSSATVYGEAKQVPVREDSPVAAISPYGQTKLVVEDLIRQHCAASPRFSAVLLRYFNPVGAHASGRIGESPLGVPNNLMPIIAEVAGGRRDWLEVYGDDYPTPDGTGVRDYLHVMDLAAAHVRALEYCCAHTGAATFNLGTGRGTSVLELVQAFEVACGRPIARRMAGRRAGDVASLYADPGLAEKELGWKATRSLAEMCADAWRWQSGNPEGFRTE